MRLRRIEPILRRALRGPCRLPEGAGLLVAVSGGADSTALLVGLHSVAPEFGLALAAAHLHHGLRGADADADLAHVRALCDRLGLPLVSARWDCRARMRRAGLSGEAGLRALRRRFLRAAARRAGAAAIATAHTADDQLETLLMRLARGTGLAGLGGMRPRHGAWHKPLLGATRHEVESDLGAARLAWREDASNADRAWLRNRIRHDVVPALLAAVAGGNANASARAALARRAAGAADDARAGARVVSRLAARALARRRGAAGLDVRGWGRLPLAIRHAALARFWSGVAPAGIGLPRRHRDALDRLLATGRSRGTLALPKGRLAELAAGRLRIVAPDAAAANPGSHPRARTRRTSPGHADARLRPIAPGLAVTVRGTSSPAPTAGPRRKVRSTPTFRRPATRLE